MNQAPSTLAPAKKKRVYRKRVKERAKPPNLDAIGRDFPRVRSVFELSGAFA